MKTIITRFLQALLSPFVGAGGGSHSHVHLSPPLGESEGAEGFLSIFCLSCCVVLAGCRGDRQVPETSAGQQFSVEVINRHTPVKNQGNSTLCWAYAMLATIETEHLMQGDSVNLSVRYAARNVLMDAARRYCLTGGAEAVSMRGMAQRLIDAIGRDGLVAAMAYRDEPETDFNLLTAKVERMAQRAVNARQGLDMMERDVTRLLDETLGTPPRRVYMFGAEYTPQEFARSVCAPGEYVSLTSFTHHPFYTRFALEVPDNQDRAMSLNVPIDTLMAVVERAVRQGHGVCWEGDISERGFSFARGIAVTGEEQSGCDDVQAARQRAFERRETTDDHCMAIVGLARDRQGGLYYIMKNSWGTDNPYGGLMYVSEQYVRMKTIAVWLPRAVLRAPSDSPEGGGENVGVK